MAERGSEQSSALFVNSLRSLYSLGVPGDACRFMSSKRMDHYCYISVFLALLLFIVSIDCMNLALDDGDVVEDDDYGGDGVVVMMI